jgi:hypothetical protein
LFTTAYARSLLRKPFGAAGHQCAATDELLGEIRTAAARTLPQCLLPGAEFVLVLLGHMLDCLKVLLRETFPHFAGARTHFSPFVDRSVDVACGQAMKTYSKVKHSRVEPRGFEPRT